MSLTPTMSLTPLNRQVLAELKELIAYRSKYLGGGQTGAGGPPILALGLSSRKNLCVHPTVSGG
jgi:DNA excision repair protein ERCC-2